MKPTIYIAGPMRGYPNFNREAFNAAARRLVDVGWQPINPVSIEEIYPCEDEDGKVDEDRLQMLMRIEREFTFCSHAIYLLNGWENSRGARAELSPFIALNSGNIFLESNGVPYASQLKNNRGIKI